MDLVVQRYGNVEGLTIQAHGEKDGVILRYVVATWSI